MAVRSGSELRRSGTERFRVRLFVRATGWGQEEFVRRGFYLAALTDVDGTVTTSTGGARVILWPMNPCSDRKHSFVLTCVPRMHVKQTRDGTGASCACAAGSDLAGKSAVRDVLMRANKE